jgi:hypothetical protein
MITHRLAPRPVNWKTLREESVRRRWLLPFRAFEWLWEWAAYLLSRWSFLEVLEYLGSLSVLVAVIFYFSESGDRIKQRHYQAWQVINTAQGKGGNGGRMEALQELNEDRVPQVGVDISSAFLQGIRLRHASLIRADLSAADLRGCDLRSSDLTYANLHFANLRGGSLHDVSFVNADMQDADLVGSDMSGADLSQANLDSADLRSSGLQGVRWQGIRSIKGANIAGVHSAPDGFVQWALQHGAVEAAEADE